MDLQPAIEWCEMGVAVDGVVDLGGYRRVAAHAQPSAPCCTRCGPAARMYRHGALTRQMRDLPQDGRPTWLTVQVVRWRCGACGGTFTSALAAAQARRRMTQRLIDWLVRESASRPASQLAREAGVDEKTVRGVVNAVPGGR